MYPVSEQSQVLGSVQLPPFWHSGAHTARKECHNKVSVLVEAQPQSWWGEILLKSQVGKCKPLCRLPDYQLAQEGIPREPMKAHRAISIIMHMVQGEHSLTWLAKQAEC